MFPFHTWLPDAHTEAPTAGSVILAAVMLKLGAYGFIRFALPLFPDASQTFAPAIIVLSLIAIIYGAVVAMVQPDLKRLVAYSSVSHMGFVTLGIFVFTEQGLQGAILQMINHGLITGALFLLVGVIYERTHDRTIAKMGGLASRTPVYAAVFGFFTFASAGLPGLSGFVGEFLVLVGTFVVLPGAAAIATFVMILAAGYLLFMYGRIVFGELSDFLAGLGDHLTDMTPVEILTLVPLGVLVVVFGIQPGLLLDLIDGDRRRTTLAEVEPATAIAVPTEVVGRPARAHRPRDRRSASPSCCVVDARPAADRSGRRGRPLSFQDLTTISPLVAADPDRLRGHRRWTSSGRAASRWRSPRPTSAWPSRPASTLSVGQTPSSAFGGSYTVDALTTFLDLLFISIVALTIAFAPDYLLPRSLPVPEFAVILLFAMTGAMLIAASTELLLLFIGLELMVLPGLPAGRVSQDRLVLDRGRDQVLPARLVQLGHLPVRPGVRVGPDRDDDRGRASRRRSRRSSPARRRCRPAWRWGSRS